MHGCVLITTCWVADCLLLHQGVLQLVVFIGVRDLAQVENLAEDAPLEELQERFKFLGQLNQYHTSVEDEVGE